MASISRDKNGRKRILLVAPDGSRKAVRLGKVSVRVAEEVRAKVEALLASVVTGVSWDGETAKWVAGLPPILARKLAAVGLIPGFQEPGNSMLGDFLDAYISKRTDLEPATICNLKIGAARLTGYFGRDRELRAISPGDCDEWLVWLKGCYAKATAGKSVKWARQFFRAAVRKNLIPRNPFEDVKAPGMANEARKFFIDRQTTGAVLDTCPSAEWRLIFALSRFGGLRCPSEHLILEWRDMDWERDRFLVRSPKTGERWVPIFPELRPYLEEVFDEAAEGAVYVINRYRCRNQNLRTQLLRILRKAGVKAWPRLFHNLRATRETELAAQYPIHVVCAWIGNTARIAAKHYLQVTDDYFDRAVKGGAKCGAVTGGQRLSGSDGNTKSPGNPGLCTIAGIGYQSVFI
jgi:integrase